MLRRIISAVSGGFNLYDVVVSMITKSKHQHECQECNTLITANTYHNYEKGIRTCLGCHYSKVGVEEVKFEVRQAFDVSGTAIKITVLAIAVFILGVMIL